MKTLARIFLVGIGLCLLSTAPSARGEAVNDSVNEDMAIAPFPEQVDGIDRGAFQIPVESGAMFEDAVEIRNRTDQNLDVSIYAADAREDASGAISAGFSGTKPVGVGSWIALSADSVSLAPRDSEVVRFKITVRSLTPSPDLGAIVIENTAAGRPADLSKRLQLVVRTAPAGSPSTSKRIRPFLLRSPWVIVAVLGLVGAILLVWYGTRRARRPQDGVTPAGELAAPLEEEIPKGSRPVLQRLGADAASEPGARPGRARTVVVRSRPKADETHAIEKITDDRPPLDPPSADAERYDRPATPRRVTPARLLATDDDEYRPAAVQDVDDAEADDFDPEEIEAEPAGRSATKLDYIPLDEL